MTGAHDPNARRRFGRYETLFRIAGGGMAEVYAARILGEGGFEKVVALKRMLPTLAEDERFVDMFLDEGRVAANISSPHVVQTTDLGRAKDDSLYLVMELVVGVPLNKLILGAIKRGEFVDLRVGVEILAQAALGLYDAHEATTPMGERLGLIHRDISPQNILVDRAGRTRITDFGVARALQRHSHTRTGEIKGKMAYFAPEQARGSDLTHRVDIFALGIVAWELIAGRRLFRSEHPLHTLRKIMEEPIPSVVEHRPDVPAALDACITKALQRDPADRYADAREFAAALRASHESASAAEIGAYVRDYASEALRPVEEGLRVALAENLRAPPETEPEEEPQPDPEAGLVVLDGEDTRFSQYPTQAEPSAKPRRLWLFALVAVVSALSAMLIAWKYTNRADAVNDVARELSPQERTEPATPEISPEAMLPGATSLERGDPPEVIAIEDLPRGEEPPPADTELAVRRLDMRPRNPSEMNTEAVGNMASRPLPEPAPPTTPTMMERTERTERTETMESTETVEPPPETDPSSMMILMDWGS